MKSVLQDWVMELGLRFQGVLVSAIRGCDTAARHDKSKVLQRIYRSEILNTHCGDPKKSKSYILAANVPETVKRMKEFLDDCDQYPLHYVMHFLHAAEIIGYFHPDLERKDMWHSFYVQGCKKLHVSSELRCELIARLESDEETFARQQDVEVKARTYEAACYGGS